jgi:hypothetical protein
MDNAQDKGLFSDEQRETILNVLKRICVGEVCISRPDLYEEVKDKLNDMSALQFSNAISQEIRWNKFSGFETRRGKNGGICAVGAFSEREKAKAEAESRAIKTPVEISGKAMLVRARPKRLHDFISIVLNGKENKDGDVTVEGTKYDCDSEMLERYLTFLSKKPSDEEIKQDEQTA